MSRRDRVVVVGGSIDGLVAAALLARSGLEVLVLEESEHLGAPLATDEIHPGFRAPAVWPGVERFHPDLIAELALDRHGLRLLPRRGGTLQLLPGGGTFTLEPGDGAGANEDAAALRAFEEERRALASALCPLLTEPLARAGAGPGERMRDLLVAARTWRGLHQAGREAALRLLPMNLRDVLDERFASDAVKAAIAGPALASAWMGPRSAGSLWNLLWQRPAWVPHLFAAPLFAEGGPGALAAALAAAAREAGARLRTGARVERIEVARGAVHGVTIAGGEEIGADRVLSALDPRRTLLELLEPCVLERGAATEARALRGRGNVAMVRLALARTPRLTTEPAASAGAGPLLGRLQLAADLDSLERGYDASKYGRIPDLPYIEAVVPSLADPGLAPAGAAVLHAWVQPVPYGAAAAEGGPANGGMRDALARTVVAALEEHLPDLGAGVLATDVSLPEDLERRFGLPQGCLDHLEPALDQQLWLRPFFGWHAHSTPIAGLYLTGPGTHPGPGPTGLPGRCAARRVLAGGPRRIRDSLS